MGRVCDAPIHRRSQPKPNGEFEGPCLYTVGVATSNKLVIPQEPTARRGYQITDPDNTSAGPLVRASEIGKEEGLHFVYAGKPAG